MPIIAHDIECTRFEQDEVGIARIPAHDLEAIGSILKEVESFSRIPEVRMQQTSASVRADTDQ